jgi:hypothetical protein
MHVDVCTNGAHLVGVAEGGARQTCCGCRCVFFVEKPLSRRHRDTETSFCNHVCSELLLKNCFYLPNVNLNDPARQKRRKKTVAPSQCSHFTLIRLIFRRFSRASALKALPCAPSARQK